jgi:hypothetical protein
MKEYDVPSASGQRNRFIVFKQSFRDLASSKLRTVSFIVVAMG